MAYTSKTAKLWLSLFPQVALQQAFSVWGDFEGNLVGLTYDNITFEVNNYTFARALYMLVISFILFTGLGLYLDKVLPKKYGERQPLYFCFTKRFCCGNSQVDEDEDGEHRQDDSLFEQRLL